MKPKVSNGRSARIRAYLATHPGQRSLEVARGINDPDRREVNHELRRMAKAGMLIREGLGRFSRYRLVSKPAPPPAPPPPPPKPMQRVESYDEWIARGGHVQVCPSHLGQYQPRAPVSYAFQHEGRRRAY